VERSALDIVLLDDSLEKLLNHPEDALYRANYTGRHELDLAAA
jgi:hypothetical protein